jgi:hypothetical protein
VSFLVAGPAAVLSAAGRARATAGALLALPGRVLVLVDRLEAAVGRVDALIDAVAATASRADDVAAAAAVVTDEADRVARLSGGVAVEARGVVAAAAESESAVATLVGAYAPTLEVLRPTLTRLAETVDPREVEAMVRLVDRLPPLLDSVDRDVLPLLGRLNEMAPDLHSLLEAVDDVRRTVAGLPGIGLLRRRGDAELEEDEEPEPVDGRVPRRGATRARR